MKPHSFHDSFLLNHTRLMLQSYEHLLGYSLINVSVNGSQQLIQQLSEAPFALVSHNTAPDPVFNYANATALALFEYSWDEFVQIPSRLSAEPINQADRVLLLNRVRDYGFIQDYQGVRRSQSGKRFRILDAIVWNLEDPELGYCGQAACFWDWEYL